LIKSWRSAPGDEMKTNRKYSFRQKLLYVAVASCFSISPVFANPNGATVVSGQVGFATQGNTLTVTNTPNAIINWQQFSIQSGEVTRFVQQNAQSAVLNRVVGQDPSQILGALLSNGRVFLVNPNGIVFGQGSVIDVAGLVASTLKLSDGDFLAGRLNFTDGVGVGGIDNQGRITTPTGGQVYLIAPDIRNSGVITSPQGEILLAAGHSVNLMDASNPNVQVTVSAPDTQAVNLGTLMAQSGKIGIYGALISQQGMLDANTAVVGANGQILLKASKDITLEPGSIISARGGGTIKVLANMQNGQVNVDGVLDASAPISGDGGFIETSGAHVKVANSAYVTTLAANGKTGTWLIDPNDFTIAASGGDMTGDDLGIALNSNNVTIYSSEGVSEGNGDIFVNDYISWGANTTLTLSAVRNIDIHKNITANGYGYGSTAGLTLNAGGMVTVEPNATNQSAEVNVGGDIVINAGGLTVRGGSVSAGSESWYEENASLTAGRDMTLTLGSRGLTIRGGSALASASGTGAYAKADALVTAQRNMTINTTGSVIIQGGSADARSYGSDLFVSASASATLDAGQDIILTAKNLNVRGGLASISGSSASAQAHAVVRAQNEIHATTSGIVNLMAGSGLDAYARFDVASIYTIYLTFTDLACCGFFVNGVDGLITTGTYSSGGSGFYNAYIPAVLNDTMFVTYLGLASTSSSSAPGNLMNFTINEINGSSLPPWVFENIRYGDWSRDDGKTECH